MDSLQLSLSLSPWLSMSINIALHFFFDWRDNDVRTWEKLRLDPSNPQTNITGSLLLTVLLLLLFYSSPVFDMIFVLVNCTCCKSTAVLLFINDIDNADTTCNAWFIRIMLKSLWFTISSLLLWNEVILESLLLLHILWTESKGDDGIQICAHTLVC